MWVFLTVATVGQCCSARCQHSLASSALHRTRAGAHRSCVLASTSFTERRTSSASSSPRFFSSPVNGVARQAASYAHMERPTVAMLARICARRQRSTHRLLNSQSNTAAHCHQDTSGAHPLRSPVRETNVGPAMPSSVHERRRALVAVQLRRSPGSQDTATPQPRPDRPYTFYIPCMQRMHACLECQSVAAAAPTLALHGPRGLAGHRLR